MFEQHVGDLNKAVLSSQRQGSKTILTIQQQHTLSRDTIRYFNVRSKADSLIYCMEPKTKYTHIRLTALCPGLPG